MAFATDIGQNLLVEVRRLQGLLNERDRAISQFQEEKDQWSTERNEMVTAVRTAEGTAGRLNIAHC